MRSPSKILADRRPPRRPEHRAISRAIMDALGTCPLRVGVFKPGHRTSRVCLQKVAVSVVLEDDEVDERMVRLESDVAHMRSDIADIKTDARELRAELKADINGLRGESRANS